MRERKKRMMKRMSKTKEKITEQSWEREREADTECKRQNLRQRENSNNEVKKGGKGRKQCPLTTKSQIKVNGGLRMQPRQDKSVINLAQAQAELQLGTPSPDDIVHVLPQSRVPEHLLQASGPLVHKLLLLLTLLLYLRMWSSLLSFTKLWTHCGTFYVKYKEFNAN